MQANFQTGNTVATAFLQEEQEEEAANVLNNTATQEVDGRRCLPNSLREKPSGAHTCFFVPDSIARLFPCRWLRNRIDCESREDAHFFDGSRPVTGLNIDMSAHQWFAEEGGVKSYRKTAPISDR
jgi:hypothetical protein